MVHRKNETELLKLYLDFVRINHFRTWKLTPKIRTNNKIHKSIVQKMHGAFLIPKSRDTSVLGDKSDTAHPWILQPTG